MRASVVKWIQHPNGEIEVLRLERTAQAEDGRPDQWQFLDWKDVKQMTKGQYQVLECFPEEFEPVSERRVTVTLLRSFDCPPT